MNGITIFFTGLPSSGKSTLAQALQGKLIETESRAITILDGDVVRLNLCKELGFSREDRMENIKRIGFVANEITKHGGIAICAAISPYKEARDHVRRVIKKNGDYVEIYVSTSLETCEDRDVKGLYKKARSGEIGHFTGVNDPYEIPSNPDLIIDTGKSIDECVARVLEYLKNRGLI